MKKLTAILMALLLIFSFSISTNATEMEATTEHPETTEYPNEPTREPDLVSESAVVIDAVSGQVLFEKNAHKKKYPASITKVMTVLLALEHNVDYNDTVTMSENAVWSIDRQSSHIGLDVGETITIEECLHAIMLSSANECSIALAEYIAGDVESFAKLMNKKAKELGCKNTHFVTPNGLHDENHYTSAYDMALITRAAMQYDAFRELAATLSYTIPSTNKKNEPNYLAQGNKMINAYQPYYYEYCEGGKTGYTTDANNTLTTYARKNNLELICVVMDCDGLKYTYTDSKALYEFCYNNYAYFYPLNDFSFESENEKEIVSNTILDNFYSSLNHDALDLKVDRTFSLLINKSVNTTQIKYEIKLFDKAKNNKLGEIIFTYDGKEIGKAPITTTAPLLSSTMHKEEPKKKGISWKKVGKVALKIVIIIGILATVVLIYMLIAACVRKIKKSRRYRYRRRRRKRDDDYFYF